MAAAAPLLVKLVLAGESCVGKTSVLRAYAEPGPRPAASYLPTVGIDFKVKTITFNDTTVKLQIWDTAGQERFHTLSTCYFRGAQGFVLVYDITNSDSFQSITKWMNEIHEKADEEVEIILLGNKCDKETDRVIPKQKGEKKADEEVEIILLGNKCDKETDRVIPKQKGEKLAWEHGIPFFETSAKDNINIEDAFSLLAEEILNKIHILCAVEMQLDPEHIKKAICETM